MEHVTAWCLAPSANDTEVIVCLWISMWNSGYWGLISDTPMGGDKFISHPQGNTAVALRRALRCALPSAKGTLLTHQCLLGWVWMNFLGFGPKLWQVNFPHVLQKNPNNKSKSSWKQNSLWHVSSLGERWEYKQHTADVSYTVCFKP